MSFWLFTLGASIGSFLNVVSLRYRPDNFLFGGSLLGRSHCPHCKQTLRWFELIPLVSFFIQGGRCWRCRTRLSFQYPLVELLSGLIFVFVPLRIFTYYLLPTTYYLLSALWILVFLVLLLTAIIDLRLSIIPDEANIVLLILGFFLIVFGRSSFGLSDGSFLGSYAMLFGLRDTIWLNHLLGAFIAGLFFFLLILVTKGRGMGMGDLKLAVPMGFAFGWPDMVFVAGLAFVIGSIVGAYTILFRKRTLRSYLPFGPFLASSATIIFFFGDSLVRWYLGLFRL